VGEDDLGKNERKPSEWTGEALERGSGLGYPEYLFYLVLQADRRREAAFSEALKGAGLTIPKWRALAVIRRLGDCAMSELAQLSAVDRTTLTRTVDQLVADGLVERKASTADRRLILLSLTPKGLETVDRGRYVNQAQNRKFLAGVPEEQARACLRVLQQIVDNQIADPDEVAYGVLTFNHTHARKP
jgi:DNA-binding MarR family transcriptional regulator